MFCVETHTKCRDYMFKTLHAYRISSILSSSKESINWFREDVQTSKSPRFRFTDGVTLEPVPLIEGHWITKTDIWPLLLLKMEYLKITGNLFNRVYFTDCVLDTGHSSVKTIMWLNVYNEEVFDLVNIVFDYIIYFYSKELGFYKRTL